MKKGKGKILTIKDLLAAHEVLRAAPEKIIPVGLFKEIKKGK